MSMIERSRVFWFERRQCDLCCLALGEGNGGRESERRYVFFFCCFVNLGTIGRA